MSKAIFVSTTGNDTNPGTAALPYRRVQRGLDAIEGPGDVVTVRGGVYVESLRIKSKHGDADRPIVITALEGESVTIDAGYAAEDEAARLFRRPVNQSWVPVPAGNGGPDEFVSMTPFPFHAGDRFSKGAMLDRSPYTRLITYSTLEDLRAQNQTFGKLVEGSGPPGPLVVDEAGTPVFEDVERTKRAKRPWVYMGPGIFQTDDGRIHVRLSHTNNQVPGFADYRSTVDPRRVPLAISREGSAALHAVDCSFLRFSHLTFRFGGETVRIHRCHSVTFDHVDVLAGGKAVQMGQNGQLGSSSTTFSHCRFDGGIPTWYFRSDRKDGYSFVADGKRVNNQLGAGTSSLLLAGASGPDGNTDTTVHHCEFVNGHDLQLFGTTFTFDHNWVHNLQDEALILDLGEVSAEVAHNVITKCLSAISFAGAQLGGLRSVHHNLIDLRRPVAGRRPQPAEVFGGPQPVERFGQFYKSNDIDGRLDLYHNTCLVRHAEGESSFQQFEATAAGGLRRSFNNIFVDIDPLPMKQVRATSVLPAPPTIHGPTDGNCYFRVGAFFTTEPAERTGVLWHRAYTHDGRVVARRVYADLRALRGDPPGTAPSEYFTHSAAVYAPGFERSSIDVDPRFRRFAAVGPLPIDDFRLRADSAARQAGVALHLLDPPIIDPSTPIQDHPDIGCYSGGGNLGGPRLEVGVDGRRRFPSTPIFL